MKKHLSTALVFLLTLSLLLSGCGKPDTVVGNWKTEVDISGALTDSLTEADPGMEEYFNFENLTFTIFVSFTEDGRFSMELDAESWRNMTAALAEQMKEQITPYLESMMDEYDVPLDDLLDIMGAGVDELIESLIEQLLTDDMLDEFDEDGFYKIEQELLYMSDDAEYFDEDDSMTFSFKDGKLILDLVDEDISDELVKLIFPMELERIE